MKSVITADHVMEAVANDWTYSQGAIAFDVPLSLFYRACMRHNVSLKRKPRYDKNLAMRNDITESLARGETQAEIADKLNVSRQRISWLLRDLS